MSRWTTPALLVWVGASALSTIGSGVAGFAITWTAAGIGGGIAGWLASASLLPSVALLLVGGALGDRWGQRRLVAVVNALQVLQYLALGLLLGSGPPLVPLLVGNAVVAGLLSGLGSPSAGVYARQLVEPDDVRAAISLSSTTGSVARLVAPSAGAVVLAWLGLRGAAWANAASFVVVLAALSLARPRHPAPLPRRRPLLREVGGGLRSVADHPQARALLGAVALLAAGLLPFVSLVLPLLGRQRGWTAVSVGTCEGAWTGGALVVSLLTAARYARRPGARPRGLVVGPVVAGLAAVGILLAPSVPLAVAWSVVMGMGTSAFTANVAPALVAAAPAEAQSRWSSVTTLSQMVPTMVATPLLGGLADLAGAWVPGAACAVLAGATALLARRASTAGRATAHADGRDPSPS